MAYPNFKNKHLEDALFAPEDFIKYKKAEKQKLPKKYIILFQSSTDAYVRKKYKLKAKECIFGGTLYVKGNVGFVKMHGIGAPHAVTVIEEMIALGGKEFVIVGTAGGLNNLGVFVCDKAIRDEGASYHYLPAKKYSEPDQDLTLSVQKSLTEAGIANERGVSWTIDAPYRETKKEIEHYRNERVVTVEMEAAAIFAVAEIRKVKAAAVFAVSDVLGKKWDPQFDKKDMKAALNKSIDAIFKLLSK